MTQLVRGLDAGGKQLAERLEEAGPAARVALEVQDEGRVKLGVDPLGALKSLTWLRRRVEMMLPKIDLPDLPDLLVRGPRARLGCVDQYYLRVDTNAAANSRPIAAQAAVSIVRFRGEGSSGASPGSTPSTTSSTTFRAPLRPTPASHLRAHLAVLTRMWCRAATDWSRWVDLCSADTPELSER